jgi:CDP-diacylglycerol--glycerol-3-phosphate 3-phosphatidyltransferase
VTCVRVVCIPAWLVVAEMSVGPLEGAWSVSAFFCASTFGILSLTDKLDGYLARSRNEVTTFGKFLDPIADKLVVVCALLVLFQWGLAPLWVIVAILAREFLVSGLRMVVASSGVVIAASRLGKWKTATTMSAIAGLLVWRMLPAGWVLSAPLLLLSQAALLAAVVLTVWSGVDYFAKAKDVLLEGDGR